MNKITKRQFEKLQDIWAYGVDPDTEEMLHEDDEVDFNQVVESGINYLARTGVESDDFSGDALENITLALMNPISSEFAKEKFVVPDPEFHFVLKDTKDIDGNYYHLVKDNCGAVLLVAWSREGDGVSFVTESEAEKWGFDLSKFGKAKEK